MAKVIQVIETEIRRGKGAEDDPIRGVTQYWSLDGDLLAESDPCVTDKPTPSIERGAKLLRDLYGITPEERQARAQALADAKNNEAISQLRQGHRT